MQVCEATDLDYCHTVQSTALILYFVMFLARNHEATVVWWSLVKWA